MGCGHTMQKQRKKWQCSSLRSLPVCLTTVERGMWASCTAAGAGSPSSWEEEWVWACDTYVTNPAATPQFPKSLSNYTGFFFFFFFLDWRRISISS